jgi:Mrp family chromosome partitioning ATPase
MERIQSAIEKARAHRQGKPEKPERPASLRRPPVPANGDDAVEALWAGIPVLVPDAKLLDRHRIPTFAGGAAAAPFDMMRTRILQQMRAKGWRRLAITSPSSGCGKTTLALNLAFSLARQTDLRTGLIELDLRRPSFAEMLGLGEGTEQFSEVLGGRGMVEDHMLRLGTTLVIGPSRQPVRESAELLQGEAAAAGLSEIDERLGLNLTIFDMPPMRVSDDMLGFAHEVDCVLLVAAAESTTIEEIDSCERDLAEQTNVLGVVLNKCRYTDSTYDYPSYD